MSSLRRSIAYSALQSYVSIGLQLVSTAILSRILTPAQIGVFGIAAVFSAIASTVRDFGISEYLIQAKDLTNSKIRAAFATNIITSWTMAFAMLIASAPVGTFYKSSEITMVMRVQTLNFLLIPFGAINMAWFRRELNFKPIFYCSVASDIAGLLVAITLGVKGMGALSLAWSSLAGISVTVIISMALRPPAIPRWPSIKGAGEVARFGAYASSLYAIGQLGRGAPEMILGRVLGVTGVAMFSRGGGLMQMFRMLIARAFGPVCMPYFARAARDEGTICDAYCRSSNLLNCLSFTVIGFLGLAAFPLIRIVYGSQWDAAVPLARILCAAGIIEVVHTMAKEALMSGGHIKVATRLQFFQQILQVLGLLFAFPFGLRGACWGTLASTIGTAALSQWHMWIAARFTLKHLWTAVSAGLFVALVALAPLLIFEFTKPADASNYLIRLIIYAPMTAIVWLLVVRWIAHPLWRELINASAPLRARFVGQNFPGA
ncbi:MAG: lipopolysaccharide biosynthesis protein [Burkholderiales bacterium]|nr:lipopolysaccharide biosynthesis protein [Burkholderiales bacterium]